MGSHALPRTANGVTNVVLRQARRSDLDAILRIEHHVFSDPWSPESFAPEFDDPYTWFRIAEIDDALVGYIVARIVAQQGEIANIAIDPQHQRSGLGGVLLDAAVEAAEAAQCEAVWLEVRLSNDPARRLYTSRGFELIGRRRGYYKAPVEDALVLRRTRTPDDQASAGK